MDTDKTIDTCSEPAVAYGRQTVSTPCLDMPCAFTEEELTAEIKESEKAGFLSHEAFVSKLASWGICR